MKANSILLVLISIPFIVIGNQFSDTRDLREYIVSNTPTRVEKIRWNPEEYKELYVTGGRLIGNRVIGFHYSLADKIHSQFEISDFVEFTKDTNVAVRSFGVVCLAKRKYDFKVLVGDEEPIFVTSPDCNPGDVMTLEEFSRELKTNYRFQYYYGVISPDEHMLEQAVEIASEYVKENHLSQELDIKLVVDAQVYCKADPEQMYWDVYFLKKKGKGKPYMGLIRVYNGEKETEHILLK